MAQLVKNPPAMQETWVWSLGWEDPLEKRMATHSSILAWRIPWTEEPGGLQSMGSQRVRHDQAWRTHRGPESPTEESQQWLLSISPQGRTRHREHGYGPRSRAAAAPPHPQRWAPDTVASGLCSQWAKARTLLSCLQVFLLDIRPPGSQRRFLDPPPLSRSVSCFSFLKRLVSTLQDTTCVLCLPSKN